VRAFGAQGPRPTVYGLRPTVYDRGAREARDVV